MPTLAFTQPKLLRFVLAVLGDRTGAELERDGGTLLIAQPTLARLAGRIEQGRPSVLPYRSGALDAWLIVGPDRWDLERNVNAASRFIVPSYAAFHPGGRLPQRQAFRSDGGALQALGAELFPEGYFSWRSPVRHYDRILERLGLWLDVEERRPARVARREPSYRQLDQAFGAALAAGNWTEAEQVLVDLRRLNLITAENLAFLSVQLLAQQQKWQTLWDLPEYPTLAQLRMPRPVRAALLTAAHATNLAPAEAADDWPGALTQFGQIRPRLGLLLAGRFGLNQAPVIQIFAYQAAIDNDLATLNELGAASSDPAVQRCIAALRPMLPPPPAPAVSLSPEAAIRQALAEADYDRATQVAVKLPLEQQVPLLLMVAFVGDDPRLAEQAVEAFWRLPDAEQARLRSGDDRLSRMLTFAEQSVAGGSSTVLLAPIADWPEWLVEVAQPGRRTDLAQALDGLAGRLDERVWTPAWAARLAEHLLPVILDTRLKHEPLVLRALNLLTVFCLRDEGFPREGGDYAGLYECLYLAQLEMAEPNQTTCLTLLRLADALLRHSPRRGADVAANLTKWFERPIPALETAALEFIDLLAEFGVSGSLLVNWHRDWVETLLALPTGRDHTSLALWLAFAEWVYAGEDLLGRLRRALTADGSQAEPEPWTALPAGYRITIFTLRPASAQRARAVLLSRMPELDIQICEEKDLNPQVEALARRADLPVIVTTAITHALTYGVKPFLRTEPVYPQSSGASSILRAVEERLRRHISTRAVVS